MIDVLWKEEEEWKKIRVKEFFILFYRVKIFIIVLFASWAKSSQLMRHQPTTILLHSFFSRENRANWLFLIRARLGHVSCIKCLVLYHLCLAMHVICYIILCYVIDWHYIFVQLFFLSFPTIISFPYCKQINNTLIQLILWDLYHKLILSLFKLLYIYLFF